MNTLGVILARAGSEGLANKHMLPLLGKPVIAYTFEHAASAQRLASVVVTTDSPEIARLARASGLMVLDRPPELATATASVQDVMLHAMQSLEMQSKVPPDAWSCSTAMSGAPGGDHRPGHRNARRNPLRFGTLILPVGKWHPAWMAQLNGDRVEALQAGSIDRRQNLQPLFLHDGAVVAVSRASMLRGMTNNQDPHAFFGVDRRGIRTEMATPSKSTTCAICTGPKPPCAASWALPATKPSAGSLHTALASSPPECQFSLKHN